MNSFQASSSLPQAILASEDPVSEEEVVEIAATTGADAKVGLEGVGPAENKEKEVCPREKSGGKVEPKSSGSKKSKNSYSIAALCQVMLSL